MDVAKKQSAERALGGLFAERKSVPTWLLYDEAGCALYERITTLPEYYLTRAEAEIFARDGAAILAHAAGGARLSIAELGAGTAQKTVALARAAVALQGDTVYLACDIASEPLAIARERLGAVSPRLEARTFVGTHAAARASIAALPGRQLLAFVGSSLGNYVDADAALLLEEARHALRDDARLLLGTDLRKDPRVLVAAYDDASGVTAAFTKNVLTRLRREWDCDLDPDHFRHVAVWNEETSSIDIFLEATVAHDARLGALDRTCHFRRGERVHVESSAKYDVPRVDRILAAAGYRLEKTWTDADGRYAVHVARVAR